jgi:hypothetical protein
MRTTKRAFKIQLRKAPTWKDVFKITKIFRIINPHDPAKYDYVFSRPAIMGYCMKDPAKNRCYLCPISDICISRQKLPETKGKPLSSKIEQKIFNTFLKIHGHEFDKVNTEYPLGTRRADAVAHMKECTWYVIEVEEKLNYTAIGQALMYRRLYKEIQNVRPEALIVCRRADIELKNACEIDAGIKVILVS